MTEKLKTARGRPVTNQIDALPGTPEEIAKAIFRAADKTAAKARPVKKKPN
jgi:hypothetical protein